MKIHSSERGSIFLPTLLLFTVIGLLLLTVAVARTTFLARGSHHAFLTMQADWLAESAIERAVSALARADDPSAGSRKFTERIAPMYVGSDPLITEDGKDDGSGRAFDVEYGYTIVDAVPLALGEDGQAGFIVVGRCDMPYRGAVLTRMKTHLCILSKDGSWTNRPVSTESTK